MNQKDFIVKHHRQSVVAAVLWPLLIVLSLWIVYWVEIKFRFNFTSFGVYPREVKGLFGIMASPFLHSGINHLYKNSIPVLVLTASLFYFYKDIAWKTLVYGLIFSGLLTWLIGRSSYHIGASGMVYFLASFLFFKGLRSKNYRLIALSLIVVFLYGSLVWGTMPGKPGISWEGHLSGFITGLVFSFILKSQHFSSLPSPDKPKPTPEKEDEFLRQFDEQGNFRPLDPEAEDSSGYSQNSTAEDEDQVTYKSDS
ncbi:rhomboid family intramembrane serine protease [Psychroflexus sediminis]|uniref:Membrane associated serine protease, rhomboid family n=1 Tax=Psychroflexus sediminis TaxID=470826 RepID=A0A1G7U4R4_9FLAO|nr:rhomboid family intramembrane serine protease [Psychroflexus sediminis]SDG41750.1 Membrane associated serine protease, rhomboid family [Psychroflexus sediminis]